MTISEFDISAAMAAAVKKMASTSTGVETDDRRREIIWVEWSDADLNAEKWDLAKATDKGKKPEKVSGKDSTGTPASKPGDSGQFDDPYPVAMPWSVNNNFTWVRPAVFRPEVKAVIYSAGGSMYPDLISMNWHILHSEFWRSFISAVNTLTYLGYTHLFSVEWETSIFMANTSGAAWKPWHHIYSLCRAGKDQHHLPQANNIGKYVVRIYWMGCWRKVIVDDKYPVDEHGRSLLPVTCSLNDKELEMWPMILSKALLKIASLTWTDEEDLVDFDMITCLTGWFSQKIRTMALDDIDVWNIFAKYTNTYTWNDVEMQAKIQEEYWQIHEPSRAASSKAPTEPSTKRKSESKSDKSSKTSKAGKTTVEIPASLFHLIVSCKDLRFENESTITDLTPCYSHDFLVELTKDIPFFDKYPEPPKEYAAWKEFRWIDWAAEHGLWIKHIPTETFKCLNIVSNLRRQTADQIGVASLSDQDQLIRTSILIIEQVIAEKEIKTGKDKKGKGDKEEKAEKAGKKGGKKEVVEFVDPSVWCKFSEMFPYLSQIAIYFKPSSFKTNVIVSNINFESANATSKAKKGKKEEKKPKATANGTDANGSNPIKLIHWENTLLAARNEPLYLFTDSIDYKQSLITLAYVGNEFPVPVIKKPVELEPPKMIPNKLQCKLQKCDGDCTCQPTDSLIYEQRSFVDTRADANVVFETYEWQSLQVGELSAIIRTYGTESLLVELDKGRHVQKIYINNDRQYVLMIMCDTDVTVGTQEEVFNCMTLESEMLTKYCYDLCSAFGNLVRYFGNAEYAANLLAFYKSYKPNVTLSKTFNARIHDTFLEELIYVLETSNPQPLWDEISRAFRVVMLDPNFRLSRSLPLKDYYSEEDDCECICKDLEGIALREKSAIIIQAYFKKIYIRKLKELHDPQNKVQLVIVESLKKVYNNTFAAKTRADTIFDLFRNMIHNPRMAQLAQYYPFYKDLTSVVQIKEIVGDIKAVQENSWCAITSQKFSSDAPYGIFIWAYMFCKMPVYLLRIFNNDTGVEMNRHTNNALVAKYMQNKNGYTVVVYGWTNHEPVQMLHWRLCLIIEKIYNALPISINPGVIATPELRANYRPNQFNLICQCIVRIEEMSVITFRLNVSSKNVEILLQVLKKNGDILHEVCGKTQIVIPALIFQQEDIENDETEPSMVNYFSGSTLLEGDESEQEIYLPQLTRLHHLKTDLKRKFTDTPHNNTDFIIQAFVLNETWPLTTKEWEIVEKLKTRDYIEPELFPTTFLSSETLKKKQMKIKTSVSSAKQRRSISTAAANEKPFWTLTSVFDSKKNVLVFIDYSDIEVQQNLKREIFKDPQRYLAGKALKDEFMDRYAIRWPPVETERLQYHLSPHFTVPPNTPPDLEPGSLIYCPECYNETIADEVVFQISPASTRQMLIPPSITDFNELMLPFGDIERPEEENVFLSDIHTALDIFDDYREKFLNELHVLNVRTEERYDFLNTWYAVIRGQSKETIKCSQTEVEIQKQIIRDINDPPKSKKDAGKDKSSKSTDKKSKK